MYDVLLISYGANGRLSPLFSPIVFIFSRIRYVRACACICVCLGMHERVCFVVVCPGIHRLFAGNAEGVVFVCIYIVLTSSLQKCTIYILFFLYVFLYSKGIESHSTAQGVPPVVASGGLGRLVLR